jgi:hypothetical protein
VAQTRLTCIFELNHLRKPGRQCSAKSVGLERRQVCVGPKRSDEPALQGGVGVEAGITRRVSLGKSDVFTQRAGQATADPMSSVAARTIAMRSRKLRASRSIFQTISVSSSCNILRQRRRAGRLVVGPFRLSLKTFWHPARFKAASYKAGFWSSRDRRAHPYFMPLL